MSNEQSALTRDAVREEAGEALSAIHASRHHRGLFEDNWRKLWQLVREAKAARLPSESPTDGPWHLSRNPDAGRYGVSSWLTAGSFVVPVWPPDAPRSPTDLPSLLNWAGVPVPDGR